MIDKLQTLNNNNIMVSYSFTQQAVMVIDSKNNKSRVFGGWPELRDLYSSYWNSFNEQSDFDSAVEYFTPTIGNLTIN